MAQPDRVYTRAQILDKVWGDHVAVEDRTVDAQIKRLRDALEIAYETEMQLGQYYERWYKAIPEVMVQQALLPFIEIQRTSIGEYADLLTRLDRAGNNEAAILLIDKELGE